jgi:hypothetical protein
MRNPRTSHAAREMLCPHKTPKNTVPLAPAQHAPVELPSAPIATSTAAEAYKLH